MTRALGIQDIIQLPRLSAAEASVLGTQLLKAAEVEAKKQALPDTIERSRKRLTVAHVALNDVLLPIEQDTQSRRKADRAVDNAWSATYSWLFAWCKLPPAAHKDPGHHAEALKLFELVFSKNLQFTRLPYRIQWHESQRRLDAIVKEGCEATFTKLGGAEFLTHIRETHSAYGDALHITKPEPEASPEVRAQLDAILVALRDYAARSAAYADPDVPGSDALSDALLKPLVTWESAQPRSESEDEKGNEPDDAPSET